MLKRFAIFSPFAWPEPISTGRYNAFLARALARAGHTVTVVCSHPLFPDWKPQPAQGDDAGVHMIRGGGWVRYPGAPFLRRLVLESWFAVYVLVQVLRLRRKLDVAVAVFPPSLFALPLWAMLPRRVRRVGIVHDLQGVYADRVAGAGVFKRAIHWVERRAFGACDQLIFLSASMARTAVASYGLKPENVRVRYPFSTLPDEPGAAVLPLRGGRVNIVYAGALGDKQYPDALLAFMDRAAAVLPEADFHVFSRGPHWQRLRGQAARRASRVQFHDLVEESELPGLYARADVQLLPQMPGTGDGSLPSKLANFLAAGSRILAFCDADGELGRLVLQANGAVVSWDGNAAVPELLRLLQQPRGQVPSELLRQFEIGELIESLVGEVKRVQHAS